MAPRSTTKTRPITADETKPSTGNGNGKKITEVVATVNLVRIQRAKIIIPVTGTMPMIVNKFSMKAQQQILDQQMAGANKTRKAQRQPKDPKADFENSMHRFKDGGHGFPAVGFKNAIIDAARLYPGVTMTELMQCLYLSGEGPDRLIRLHGEVTVKKGAKPDKVEPNMRQDMVRVGSGMNKVADVRFRAEYWPWSCELEVVFIPSVISAESVVALVDASGMGGVGEWRPSKAKTGIYGTYEVPE